MQIQAGEWAAGPQLAGMVILVHFIPRSRLPPAVHGQWAGKEGAVVTLRSRHKARYVVEAALVEMEGEAVEVPAFAELERLEVLHHLVFLHIGGLKARAALVLLAGRAETGSSFYITAWQRLLRLDSL